MAGVASGTDWLERAAAGASALCIAHCLPLPTVMAIMPGLSSALDLVESVHLWLLAAAVPMTSAALIRGRAVHGRSGPMLAGIGGLLLLAAGALMLEGTGAETPTTVAGGVAIVIAHASNWRRRHGCGC